MASNKWIDLLDQNGERKGCLTPIFRQKLQQTVVYLTVYDGLRSFSGEQVQALKSLGFRAVKATTDAGHQMLASPNFVSAEQPRKVAFTKQKLQTLQSVYPGLRVGVEMDSEKMLSLDYGSPTLERQREEAEQDKAEADATTNDLFRIGLNKHRQTIYSGNGGQRYIENEDGSLSIAKRLSRAEMLILSGTNQQERDGMLDGMVEEFKATPDFDQADVQRYIDALLWADNPEIGDNTRDSWRSMAKSLVDRTLNTAAYKALIGNNYTDYEALESAEGLYDRNPVKDASGFHPSVAAGAFQYLTAKSDPSETSILVANPGDGREIAAALGMGLNSVKANSTNVEQIDPELRNSDVTMSQIDTREQSLDADSANTMLVSYDNPVDLDTPVNRDNYSYQYAHEIETVNTLRGLTDEGMAIVQVPSINTERDRQFVNMLNTLFAVEAVAKLDKHGFNKNNDQIMVAISSKRLVQDATLSFNDRFSNFTSPRESFDWLRIKGEQISAAQQVNEERLDFIDDIDRSSLSAVANQISARNDTKIVNPMQVRYSPISRDFNSESTNIICIPRSLQRATNIAQARMMQRLEKAGFTGADAALDFLSDRLQYDKSYLMDDMKFGPHQLDKITQAILLLEQEGRSMIDGSGTGTGKTRMMALMSRYNLLHDRPVYLSGHNDGIFQKFVDEMIEIDSFDLMKPYVLNHNVKIYDATGAVITRGANEVNHRIMKDRDIPDANIIFATVGQTNRAAPQQKRGEELDDYKERLKETKTAMIHRWMETKPPYLIIDESHTSGGQSNSFEAANELIKRSVGLLPLSGTSVPSVHAINLYKKAFPQDMDTDELEESLRKGGLPMSEAIITALAEDGAYSRVELPDEKHFKLRQPSQQQVDFNVDSANSLAGFFDYYTSITGEVRGAVSDMVARETEQEAKEKGLDEVPDKKPSELGFDSMHFGSKVSHVTSSTILIHNAMAAADQIERAIKDNRKVVYTMQHTGQTQLERNVEKYGQSNGLVTFPTMRDMCQELLENIYMVDRRIGKRIVKVDIREEMGQTARAEFDKRLKDALEFVQKNIPNIPFTPLDTIRAELDKRGITSTEISSRNYELRDINTKQGTAKYVPRKNNTAQSIEDYHNGKADVILMTSAGATGFDMHARKDMPDKRLVTMIYGELDNWAVTVLQSAGRVDRMNQVGKPEYEIADPGLPAVTRMIENTIKKIAFVSSATTANAKNTMIKSPHDGDACILSEPGMHAVIQYLTFNPKLASRLYMESEVAPFVADREAKITYNSQVNISHKFLSRLMMLPPTEALNVINDVSAEADNILKEQQALGIDNSGGVRFLDIKGTITNKTVVQASPDADNRDNPLLGDVVAYEVKYKVHNKPMSTDDVMSLIDVGSERLKNDKYFEGKGLSKTLETLEDNYHEIMYSSLPKIAQRRIDKSSDRINSIESEINRSLNAKNQRDGLSPVVNHLHEALTWVMSNVERLGPGGVINYTPTNSIHEVDGVIVGLNRPRPGQEHNLSQWGLNVAVPGKSEPQNVSLIDIYRSASGQSFDVEEFSDTHMLALDFDSQVASSETKTLNVISGNLPKGALMLRNVTGVMSINFTDDQGNVRRGFHLPDKLNLSDLKALEQPMPSVEVAAEYLRDNVGHRIATHTDAIPNRHATIQRDVDNTFVLQVPRNAVHGGIYHDVEQPYNDPISGEVIYKTELEHITGSEWEMKKAYNYIEVPDNKLEEVLACVEHCIKHDTEQKLFGGKGSNEWLNRYFEGQQREQLSAVPDATVTKDSDAALDDDDYQYQHAVNAP